MSDRSCQRNLHISKSAWFLCGKRLGGREKVCGGDAPKIPLTIKAGTIDEDVSGRKYTQTPSFFAAGVAVARAEIGVEVGIARCKTSVESCGI